MRKAPFECPQDSLRQAQGERIWEARLWWGVGVGWGTETPRAAPLWIPAFAGMTRAEDPLRVPSGQASTGSGRTDLGGAPSVGSGGGMGDGDAPRRAPLDTGFRRYDGGGGGAGECCWCRAGFPLSRDGRFANRPYGVGVGVGSAKGVGDGGAPPMPLWIPAFAGMTQRGRVMGAVGGGTLRQAERTREFAYGLGLAFGDPRQSVVGAPRPSGFLPSQECREGRRLGS